LRLLARLARVRDDAAMRSFFFCAVTFLGFAACGGNVVVDPPPHGGGKGGSPVGTSSSGAGTVISDGGGPSVGCAGNAGCSPNGGSAGFGGGTGFGCMSDADCLAGETCDLSTGTCVGMAGVSCHQCACVNTFSEGGCANICSNSGTPYPNFCDGVPALPKCAACLADHCGGIAFPPIPTDPSACM
jgi:hypothetical protein